MNQDTENEVAEGVDNDKGLEDSLAGAVGRSGARGIATTVTKALNRAAKTMPGRIPTRVIGKAADTASLAVDAATQVRGIQDSHRHTPLNKRLLPIMYNLSKTVVMGTVLFEVFDEASPHIQALLSVEEGEKKKRNEMTHPPFSTLVMQYCTSVPFIAGGLAGLSHGLLSRGLDMVVLRRTAPTASLAGTAVVHAMVHSSLFGTFFYCLPASLSLLPTNADGTRTSGDTTVQHNTTAPEIGRVLLCGAIAGITSEAVGSLLSPIESRGMSLRAWRAVVSSPLPARATLLSGAFSGALGFVAYLFAT